MKNNTFFFLIASLWMFACNLQAEEAGLMYGTPLPDPFASGPTVASKHADIKMIHHEKKLLLQLPIHQPEGALLTVLSEHEAQVFQEDHDEAISTLNETGLGLNEVIQQPLPVFAKLDKIPTGHQNFIIKPISNPEVELRFIEKQSPLTLFAKAKPLAVTQSQTFSIQVWFDDQEPIQYAEVSIQDKKLRKLRLTKNQQGLYQIKLNAPAIKNRELVDYKIHAEGTRFDGSPFLRTANVSVMAIEAKSGFSKPPEASMENIAFEIKESHGSYRLELIYGHQGKSIAWQRHRFFMDDKPLSFKVLRPDNTLAADTVIIKLLNMDTLGLEDVAQIDLPYDGVLYKKFSYPIMPSQELPEVKKKALAP